MKYKRRLYTTADKTMTIDFVFMDLGELGWRVYIISPIDFQGRDGNRVLTHRNHFSGDTYESICWDKKIDTYKQARAVASFWAETLVRYIRYGGSFDEIAGQMMA